MNSSGQGTIEFVLLIIVTVALVLALVTRFFQPLRKYAQFYIGDYVECLLDEGSLPSLGGQDQNSDCGAPPNVFIAGDAGSFARAREASEKKGEAEKRKDSGSSKLGSSATAGGGGVIISRNGRGFVKASSTGADGTTASSENSSNDKNGKKRTRYYQALGSNTPDFSKPKNTQQFSIAALPFSQRPTEEKPEDKRIPVAETSNNIRGKTKRLELKRSQRASASVELQQEEWSFGKIFRFVIILLVIIALVLVVGGQLNQMRKGSEK